MEWPCDGSWGDLGDDDCTEKLIDKLEEYIKFLVEGYSGPMHIAHTHGWRCPQDVIDKGEKFRKEIEDLKKRI